MTNCRIFPFVAACIAVAGHALPSTAGEGPAKGTTAVREKPLDIVARLAEKRDHWYVGDKIRVVAALKNSSKRDIRLTDWTKAPDCSVWGSQLEYEEFPGKIKGQLERWGWSGQGYNPAGVTRVLLKPGAVSKGFEKEFTLPLPGRAQALLCFDLAGAAYSGEKLTLQTKYKRILTRCVSIPVAAEMSPKMAQRYAAARQRILDEDVAPAEALDVLRRIADERNYFAARLVREVWAKEASGPLKTAALVHLVDLLDTGVAYEALPDLLGVLRDEPSPKDCRARLVRCLGKMHLMEKCAGLLVEGVGYYNLPRDVREKAKNALRAVAKGDDRALAEQAKAILTPPNPNLH